MRVPTLLLVTALVASPVLSAPAELGEKVSVRALSGTVWLHTSAIEPSSAGAVPSNGLLLLGRGEAVLIDPPATAAQTEVLLDWSSRRLGAPVHAVIVTGAGAERSGGLDAAHERRIATYGLAATARLARAHGLTAPRRQLPDDGGLALAGRRLHCFFPGPGHAPDNLVLWLPDERLLYAGGLVKEAAARTIGEIAGADLDAWRSALERLLGRYPGAVAVVPGRGKPGSLALVHHTLALLHRPPAHRANRASGLILDD